MVVEIPTRPQSQAPLATLRKPGFGVSRPPGLPGGGGDLSLHRGHPSPWTTTHLAFSWRPGVSTLPHNAYVPDSG
ncbi:hypothetical protein ElyMa_003100600 [Elysia marginata]|uniref:Uncharacterized protein n=1 Tax=Elysia marginata TaxID=1093978 RepID=A0AAV4INL6_9GAST|nr:hypothetical protein ElyMa_003100600 [Elysia marginata]